MDADTRRWMAALKTRYEFWGTDEWTNGRVSAPSPPLIGAPIRAPVVVVAPFGAWLDVNGWPALLEVHHLGERSPLDAVRDGDVNNPEQMIALLKRAETAGIPRLELPRVGDDVAAWVISNGPGEIRLTQRPDQRRAT